MEYVSRSRYKPRARAKPPQKARVSSRRWMASNIASVSVVNTAHHISEDHQEFAFKRAAQPTATKAMATSRLRRENWNMVCGVGFQPAKIGHGLEAGTVA